MSNPNNKTDSALLVDIMRRAEVDEDGAFAFTGKSAAEELGVAEQTIYRMLNELSEQKVIERITRGRYKWLGDAESRARQAKSAAKAPSAAPKKETAAAPLNGATRQVEAILDLYEADLLTKDEVIAKFRLVIKGHAEA